MVEPEVGLVASARGGPEVVEPEVGRVASARKKKPKKSQRNPLETPWYAGFFRFDTILAGRESPRNLKTQGFIAKNLGFTPIPLAAPSKRLSEKDRGDPT